MSGSMNVCAACQAPVPDGQAFCQQCGRVVNAPAEATPATTVVAAQSLSSMSPVVWFRTVPPVVVFLGAFLPWVTFALPANLSGPGAPGPFSFSLFSAGGSGILSLFLLAGGVAVGAWPLWRTEFQPGWLPRVWLATGAVFLGIGVTVWLGLSSMASLLGRFLGAFGGSSPLHVGFGLVLTVLGSAAWVVVAGRREWN